MLVGVPLKRKEDARLVAGRGRYLDDIALPGTLHLGLVRSPHAHARVLHIERERAGRADGVVAVWTIAHLPELLHASVPPFVPEPRGRAYRHPVLAGDRVRLPATRSPWWWPTIPTAWRTCSIGCSIGPPAASGWIRQSCAG